MISNRTVCFLVFLVLLIGACSLAQVPAPGTNLLSNPGFESGTTNWSYADPTIWKVVTDVYHSGGRSMRVVNSDPNRYTYPRTAFAIPGKCQYRMSAWVRTSSVQGTDTGAAICLEWYDASGNWLGGEYPNGIEGTNGWTQITSSAAQIPDNATTAVAVVYLRKGCTGTAWFDDVKVEAVDRDLVFRPFMRFPNYRASILPGQTRRLALSVDVNDNSAYPFSNLMLNVSVMDAYNRVRTTLQRNLTGDTTEEIDIALGSLSNGDYRARVELKARTTGLALKSQDMPFTIWASTSTRPKVYIDEHNRCVVNGSLFFPVGFYATNAGLSAIDRAKSLKYNCIMDYNVITAHKTLSSLRSYLDALNNRGMKLIFSVKDCYEGTDWAVTRYGSWTNSYDVFRGMVNTFRGHSAILAWYLNDELSGSYIPEIQKRYNYLRANDVNHPAWQVQYLGQNVQDYLTSSDVFGIDNYPVLTQCQYRAAEPRFEVFGQAADEVKEATLYSRSSWMVPECSSMKYVTSSSRPPTAQEVLCEAYQALTRGARGLVFFNLSRLIEDGESQWQAMAVVGDNLDRIKWIALGYDAPVDYCVSVSDPRISLITRIVGSDFYVLAVNPYNEPMYGTFKLGSASSATSVDVGLPGVPQRTLPVVNNTFADEIEPLGTRVYRLR